MIFDRYRLPEMSEIRNKRAINPSPMRTFAQSCDVRSASVYA